MSFVFYVTKMIENSFHCYGGQFSDELPDSDPYQGKGEVASFPISGVPRDSSWEAVHH